ncbi:LamB/YcsF family protein, partial [Pseudomonas aeruginosa]
RRVADLDPQQVADKVLRACRERKVRTVEREDLDIAFDSVCIHSDPPGALELVASTRARLEGAGIRIQAPR